MKQESLSKQKSFWSKPSNAIGVILGGHSSEAKISRRSGRAVAKALKEAGWKVCLIDPAKSSSLRTQVEKVSSVFIALHGLGGEDGSLQEQLEKWGIPYTGSCPKASYLAFDKALSKNVLVENHISTADYKIVSGKNWKRQILEFGVPFFVKPLQEGSSIGVYEVVNIENSWAKLQSSKDQYKTFMIERTIHGREFTVGVLGKKALPVVELKPKSFFYDYHSKYTKGMTSYIVPAKISNLVRTRLQVMALRVHKILGLRDMSRIDFKVDQKNRPYVLEANSIPGFTALSLLPKAARAAGISFPELCSWLVQQSLKRA